MSAGFDQNINLILTDAVDCCLIVPTIKRTPDIRHCPERQGNVIGKPSRGIEIEFEAISVDFRQPGLQKEGDSMLA
jgi:hypothetical protein